MAPATSEEQNSRKRNLDVDYVIRYRFGGTDVSIATEQLERLLRILSEKGIQTQVRRGDEATLLIFARASPKGLSRALHRSRVRDWLYGVRNTEPEPADSIEPQTEAERLRVIYHLITLPKEIGGAGITPKHGEWPNVDAIFPLHDVETNQKWMREWTKKTFLSQEDLDQISGKFGETVGFYFAFLQSYFKFLVFPAAFGASCWLMLGNFSVIYSVVNSLWCIVFIQYWKRSEVELSCRWQTKGISAVHTPRREFQPLKEVRDHSTGEVRGVFPATTRMYRQLLQIPFAVLSALALGAILATCFAIEIFISEIYHGPFEEFLAFVPTILVSSLVPTMSAVLQSVARKLNDYENYETQDAYDVALTRKIFVINFVTSYLPICLTAFIYVPFASVIVPYLNVFQPPPPPKSVSGGVVMAKLPPSQFRINKNRLRNQVIYFTVTAQVVNFALEAVVPYVKQRLFRKYKAYTTKKAAMKTGSHSSSGDEKRTATTFEDTAAEKKFLDRVRNEADLPAYDVTNDFREMCIQFGYLSLFSPVWPLVPVSFFINNWVEARGDFFKICVESRRPVPARADTIGPWLDCLGFLAWLGSITSAALVYMFSNGEVGPNGQPTSIQGWALLLTIFFSEHLYLVVQYVVQAAMSTLDPPSARKQRAEQYLMRKRYLEATLHADSEEDLSKTANDEQKAADPTVQRKFSLSEITPASLEEDARASTLQETDPAEKFWLHQVGWRESAKVGVGLIQAQQAANADSKKQR